jgi:4-hydroxybenzoate polyprenyltransferase
MNALARVRAFASLVRLSHTVFALPFALAGLVLARSVPHVPLDPARLCAILVAIAAARTAAMAWNRLVDRDLDARNPRTATREIPSGVVSPRSAMLLVGVTCTVFVLAAFALGTTPGLLSAPVLAVLLGYSHAKRFTWGCHLWLGLALALAPGGAWIAAGAAPSWGIAALMLAVGSWVAGFDILYALADESFDRAHGVRSIPARFGAGRAIAISRSLHTITVIALALTGIVLGRGIAYFVGVAAITALLVYEHGLITPADLSKLDRAFFDVNGYVSVGFLVLTGLDEVLR